MCLNLQNMIVSVLILYVFKLSASAVVSASGDNVVINVIDTKLGNITNTADDTTTTATTNVIATGTSGTGVTPTIATVSPVKGSDAATTESIVSTTHPVHKDHRKPCSSSQHAQAACLNGGICFAITIGGFTSSHCNCPKLFTGIRCESIDPNYFLNGGTLEGLGWPNVN